MCQYKSAVVLPNGDLIHHEATDHHDDLLLWAGLADTSRQPNFVRVEFTGPDLGDIATYALKVDQDYLPQWWTSEMADDVARRLRALCERSIVSDRRKILLGGVWVLVGDAFVDRAENVRIVSMRGSSQVGEMQGSSQVGTMGGSSQVGEMWGSSQVGTMGDSSQVGAMGPNAKAPRKPAPRTATDDIVATEAGP